MGQIPVIVQGKLSERRSGSKVTGCKLQRWRHGRNQTRHVPATLVETVRQGTQGYAQFMRLAQEYVEVRESDALEAGAGGKKKPTKR
jgi:uncharacterized protein with von Willebrand factor type A (vWA) domain